MSTETWHQRERMTYKETQKDEVANNIGTLLHHEAERLSAHWVDINETMSSVQRRL